MKSFLTTAVSYTLLIGFLLTSSCKKTTGPYDLGGSGDVELTTPGNDFPVSVNVGGNYDPRLSNLQDTTIIVKRENGIVTFKAVYHFDTAFVYALDTMMGTYLFPIEQKKEAMSRYLKRFGATLDSTNKNDIVVKGEFKAKITSEGIAEYFSSNGDVSRPRTIVKYGWNVGDGFSFKTDDGLTVNRKTIQKSTDDDYPLAFWLIKTIQVEETSDDPLVEKMIYIANHKFGLVGIKIILRNGKEAKIGIFPPNL